MPGEKEVKNYTAVFFLILNTYWHRLGFFLGWGSFHCSLNFGAPFLLQFEKREWAKTLIHVKDTKPARLPIVDVGMKDIGTLRHKFKLEIGPVCYS